MQSFLSLRKAQCTVEMVAHFHGFVVVCSGDEKRQCHHSTLSSVVEVGKLFHYMSSGDICKHLVHVRICLGVDGNQVTPCYVQDVLQNQYSDVTLIPIIMKMRNSLNDAHSYDFGDKILGHDVFLPKRGIIVYANKNSKRSNFVTFLIS